MKKFFCFVFFLIATNVCDAQWYSGSIEHKYWDLDEAPLNFDFTKKEKEKMFKDLAPKYITDPLKFPQSNKYYNLNKNNNIYFYSPYYLQYNNVYFNSLNRR